MASPAAISAERTRSRDSPHRLVTKANDREGDIAVGNLHLNINRPGLDPLEGDCCDSHHHA
jgi:hypothetical protein